MKVTFEFEHNFEFLELMQRLSESATPKTRACCNIDKEPEHRFIDGDGNIYTADEMNDFLIDSDGIGAA